MGDARLTDGRTDMTTLIVAFRNFANAPKIEFYLEIYRLLGFTKWHRASEAAELDAGAHHKVSLL